MFQQRKGSGAGSRFQPGHLFRLTLVAGAFASVFAVAAMAAALFAPPPPQKPNPKRSTSRIRRSLLMRGTARARPSG